MQKIITAFNQILTPLCKIQKSAWFKEEKDWKPSQGRIRNLQICIPTTITVRTTDKA